MVFPQYPAAEQQLPKGDPLQVYLSLYPHVASLLTEPGACVALGVLGADEIKEAVQGPL